MTSSRRAHRSRGAAQAAATLLLLMASAAGLASVACSDADDASGPAGTPAATETRPASTPARTAAAATPVSNGSQEVVGIVGAVNRADSRIEINRLSGADVVVVVVTPATRILSGQGRTLTLGDLRPSDRIIASGAVDGAEMTADRVEIQAVLPGASPGG